MPQYLLSTQALADSARNEITPIHAFCRDEGIAVKDIFVSAASFALFKCEVESYSPKDPDGVVWRELFETAYTRLSTHDRILPVDNSIALRFADIEPYDLEGEDSETGSVFRLRDCSLLVLATALERGLTLLDYRQSCHDVLIPHGLIILDPYV